MDRFIECGISTKLNTNNNLKSNMDRFIDFVYDIDKDVEKDLKSNMDRFIVTPFGVVDFRTII